jgi:hypothetical protein
MEPTWHTNQARPHHQARTALQVRPAWQMRPALQARSTLPGVAAPTPCHVLGPKHFLPRVHNLDERDWSRKRRFDRMDEVMITWINGSTSSADQLPRPSFQEHPERHQAKAVHPMASLQKTVWSTMVDFRHRSSNFRHKTAYMTKFHFVMDWASQITSRDVLTVSSWIVIIHDIFRLS